MLENNNINIWIIFSHKLCKNMKKRHYFEKKSPKKGTLRTEIFVLMVPFFQNRVFLHKMDNEFATFLPLFATFYFFLW